MEVAAAGPGGPFVAYEGGEATRFVVSLGDIDDLIPGRGEDLWGVELFVAVSVRARASVLFLPQILMAYLAALHCYLFKWPFGFRYVALGACILYILHACCFFFNRHELKALREGSVSAALPRDTGPACDAVSTSRRSPPRRQHTD